MTDFTALPVYNGVGPYHFNRYRVVFSRPPGTSKESLARRFTSGFPHYFNSRHATVVFHADKTFDAKPTFEFHGIIQKLGVNIAKPHNDWVARIQFNPDVGFTAQTLKREFLVTDDNLPAIVGGVIGGGTTGAESAVHLNQMHFLAGRRSWRLDSGSAFGVPGDVCVLETAAVERFSSQFFVAGDIAFHLEELIPAIWIANLGNFVRMCRLTTVEQDTRKPWEVVDHNLNISKLIISSPTIEELKKNPEFIEAYRLYPTLLP